MSPVSFLIVKQPVLEFQSDVLKCFVRCCSALLHNKGSPCFKLITRMRGNRSISILTITTTMENFIACNGFEPGGLLLVCQFKKN